MAYIISSSDGTYLRFETDAEHQQYRDGQHDLVMRAYAVMLNRYGVWASNQDKYVASADLFNQNDSRHMEQQYDAWVKGQ